MVRHAVSMYPEARRIASGRTWTVYIRCGYPCLLFLANADRNRFRERRRQTNIHHFRWGWSVHADRSFSFPDACLKRYLLRGVAKNSVARSCLLDRMSENVDNHLV